MEMTSALTYASLNPSVGGSVAVNPARRFMAMLMTRRFMDVAVRRVDVPQ